jgi:hypothetical protein
MALAGRTYPLDRVTDEQLTACRRDAAWEARQGLANRVVCRECGALASRLSSKKGHLWTRHRMSVAAYRRRFPCVRLHTFADVARAKKLDVAELMARTTQRYATPEELERCRKDPFWEQRQGIRDVVVCRECGAKRFALIGGTASHLRARHGWSTRKYLSAYPSAPRQSESSKEVKQAWVGSEEGKKRTNAASRRWKAKHPGQVRRGQARYWRRPENREKKNKFQRQRYHLMRTVFLGSKAVGFTANGPPTNGSSVKKKRGRPSKTELFRRARDLHNQGLKWPQVAVLLIPDVAKDNRHAAAERLRMGVLGLRKAEHRSKA